MVDKTLDIGLDELCAVVHQGHPGDGWFCAAEVAEHEGISSNAAYNRLQLAYRAKKLDKVRVGSLVYFKALT